jgi:hypothetical protein
MSRDEKKVFIPGKVEKEKYGEEMWVNADLYNRMNEDLKNCRGDEKAMKKILAKKFGDFEYSAIHLATLFSDKDLIRFYAQMDLPFDVVDKFQSNALHLLFGECEDFNLSIMLLGRGVNPNQVDANGDTAFHIACARCNNHNIIDFMLQKVADVNLVNGDGKTGFEIMADALVESVEERDEFIRKEDLEILKLIAEHPQFKASDADISAIEKLGVYCRNGCVNLIKEIGQHLNPESDTPSKAVAEVRSKISFADKINSVQGYKS